MFFVLKVFGFRSQAGNQAIQGFFNSLPFLPGNYAGLSRDLPMDQKIPRKNLSVIRQKSPNTDSPLSMHVSEFMEPRFGVDADASVAQMKAGGEYFEQYLSADQSKVTGGVQVNRNGGRITGIVDNSTDGSERNTYLFSNDKSNILKGSIHELFNEDGIKTSVVIKINKGNLLITLGYDSTGEKVENSSIMKRDQQTGSYEPLNLDHLFLREMDKKVGSQYYLAGGNSPTYNGRSNVDKNGNYLGYDCSGGIMDSIRDITGLDLPQMNPGIMQDEKWLEKIGSPSNSDLIFVNYNPGDGKFDHVMTYNQWTNPEGKNFDLITTIGLDPDFQGVSERGYLSKEQKIDTWQNKSYRNANFEYRKINWSEMFNQYGKNIK